MLFWYNIHNMFIGEFKFNLHDALMSRGAQYCRAYHTTNEPITQWLPLTQIKNPRVLTVAASGDQPLMYAAYGASQIDTFDITVNACAVMDFKTTALQTVANISEYTDAVQSLIKLDELDQIGTRQFSTFMRIVDNMPMRTKTLMQNIIKTHLYQTAFSQHVSHKLRFPCETTQFEQIQTAIKSPFNFIWADLTNVHKYIDGNYDIINVSNIFDHYLWYKDSPKSVFDAINSLTPHLRTGGYMICTSTDSENLHTVRLISTMIANLHANISTDVNPLQYPWQAIVLQKTR